MNTVAGMAATGAGDPTLVEALLLHAANRAGDLRSMLLPYTRQPDGTLRWADTEPGPTDQVATDLRATMLTPSLSQTPEGLAAAATLSRTERDHLAAESPGHRVRLRHRRCVRVGGRTPGTTHPARGAGPGGPPTTGATTLAAAPGPQRCNTPRPGRTTEPNGHRAPGQPGQRPTNTPTPGATTRPRWLLTSTGAVSAAGGGGSTTPPPLRSARGWARHMGAGVHERGGGARNRGEGNSRGRGVQPQGGGPTAGAPPRTPHPLRNRPPRLKGRGRGQGQGEGRGTGQGQPHPPAHALSASAAAQPAPPVRVAQHRGHPPTWAPHHHGEGGQGEGRHAPAQGHVSRGESARGPATMGQRECRQRNHCRAATT